MVSILSRVAVRCPTALRVKEVFETVEAAALIGREVDAAIKEGTRRRTNGRKQQVKAQALEGTQDHPGVTTVYDFACGHGLVSTTVGRY